MQLDRPDFALNPTSCARKETLASLPSTAGGSANPSSSYAATGCGRLAFDPKAAFRLFGPTHRGGFPRLRTVIRPSGGAGTANIGAFSVALPNSEFIANAHFSNVCTRVKFAAEECPAGSIYGHVKAVSPLFDFPLEGNIYLRSSDHLLPDLVAALKGPASMPIEIDSVGRVDSTKFGGIRTTFETVPDAPVTEIVATLPGGKKGLFENSANLCKRVHRVVVKLTGQNGRSAKLQPVLRASCK